MEIEPIHPRRGFRKIPGVNIIIILFIQFITGFFLEVLIYLFPQRFGQVYCPSSRRHYNL